MLPMIWTVIPLKTDDNYKKSDNASLLVNRKKMFLPI